MKGIYACMHARAAANILAVADFHCVLGGAMHLYEPSRQPCSCRVTRYISSTVLDTPIL